MKFETLLEQNIDFATSAGLDAGKAHEPKLATVSCCDARIPQGQLFGTETGETFTVANIGNRVWKRLESGQKALRASVLYPVAYAGAETVIVIGHTGCGAITATYEWLQGELSDPDPSIRESLQQLRDPVRRGLDVLPTDKLSRQQLLAALAELNVDDQVAYLQKNHPGVEVVGVICDVHDLYPGQPGQCHLINYRGETTLEVLSGDLQRYFHRIAEGF